MGDALPVYYVVDRQPALRAGPGTGRVLGQQDFRRGVRVQAVEGPWRLVQDVETGQPLGWVEHSALSNLWLLVDKPSRTLMVYRGGEVLHRFPIDVSLNPDDDKVRRGDGDAYHYRIPEGDYFVVSRNPNSQFYLSFMLNYPNKMDADRGLARGLINRAQHQAIVRAWERFESPPMGTRLGGAIAIHGQGSGRQRAWTRGCVALRDIHMDMLWQIVRIGTPVFIR
jgi:murein L,D-transpeptidase YafK